MSKDFQKLSSDELEAAISSLDGWQIQDGKLHKEFGFNNFTESFGFAARVALTAQELGHHPDIFCDYNHVVLTLWTHSVKEITSKDVELAQLIDKHS